MQFLFKPLSGFMVSYFPMYQRKQSFQYILITGASSGIGQELAQCYASPNTTLYLTGRNPDALAQTALACQQQGATVHYHTFDITDNDQLSQFLSTITTPLDLIIANAGASGGNRINGTPESLETIDTLINVNLRAPIRLTRLLIDKLRQQKQGHFVYVSSVMAFRGFSHSPTYCATKAGLKAYSEGLRAWLRPDNIHVSIVYPGFVKTAMSDRIDSPKPLMMSAKKAAKIIQYRLAKNAPIIRLSLLYYYAVRLMDLLPLKWIDRLMSLTPTDVPEPRK